MKYSSIKQYIKKEKAEGLDDAALLSLIYNRLNKSTRARNRYAGKDFLITADEDNLIIANEYLCQYRGDPPPFKRKEKEGKRLYDLLSVVYPANLIREHFLNIYGTEEGVRVLRGLGVN